MTEDKSWQDEVRRMRAEMSWTEIARAMRSRFPGLSETQVREKVRTAIPRSHATKKETEPAEQKPEKQDVVQNHEPAVHEVNWKGNRIVRFGLIGDTHINNKFAQISLLHDIYDHFEHEGIKHVYHAGDIDDGEQMRAGHQYECYTQGADAHRDEIVRIYPRRDNITTHFITGNHDASLMRRAGYNIGTDIAKERDDMEYLGADCAIVMLTPNCSLELRHPWDGTAYALSYKPQKLIESLSGGEKTNILAIGHYHKIEYLFYRNVHCFQTGTLCAQTPYMKGKAIAAHMGGWIVTIEVDGEGHIQRITPEMIPYYKAIPDDYKNWQR
jgi:predicted phosphodiesterase